MAEVTGPISSLPGRSHAAPEGMTCDQHLNRPAVARIQGETDSFGYEMIAALSDAEPVSSRNDEAGYVEFMNEDVPYLVRDIRGPVAILTDLETRNVIGYRVYDPGTTVRAAHDLRVIREAEREQKKPTFRLQDGMPFGISVLIDMPPGCDMVAVFANHPHHVPVWMGLPHQLYVTTFAKLLHDNAAESLTIVPYRNATKVTVTENDIALALAEWASQPALSQNVPRVEVAT